MLANAFVGKPEKPNDAELGVELGSAKPLWDRLLAELAKQHDSGTQEWSSYSRKAGWSLKVKHEQRTVLYLSPSRGCFMASFALGDKAVRAARRADLPQRALEIINAAKRYAEGTAVRIDVHGTKDLTIVEKLAAIKLEN